MNGPLKIKKDFVSEAKTVHANLKFGMTSDSLDSRQNSKVSFPRKSTSHRSRIQTSHFCEKQV